MMRQTAKQRLLTHLRELHPHLYFPKSSTFDQLGKIHAGAHHRYSVSHDHAGDNRGPDVRPPGWRTGEDPIMKGRR